MIILQNLKQSNRGSNNNRFHYLKAEHGWINDQVSFRLHKVCACLMCVCVGSGMDQSMNLIKLIASFQPLPTSLIKTGFLIPVQLSLSESINKSNKHVVVVVISYTVQKRKKIQKISKHFLYRNVKLFLRVVPMMY